MRRSPPVMSFTFFAKSFAYSWKMSLAGQVLCQRIEIGPCALTIIGKPSVAAPVAAAAPRRNLRREALIANLLLVMVSMECGLAGDSRTVGRQGVFRSARRANRFASFVRGVPSDDGQHNEETGDVRDGDMPAVPEPLPDRLRLRVHVGDRHTGGGTEPDHRS